MKIAVFDPKPRICGPTTAAFAMRDGFRELGHRADAISLTRSGKPTVHWGTVRTDVGFSFSGFSPDRVEKFSDGARVFDEYDLVYVSEPKCPPLDRRSKKNATKAGTGEWVPEYVRALLDSKTPWVTRLGGPLYDRNRAPHLATMLQRKPLLVLSDTTGCIRSGKWAGLHENKFMRDPKVIKRRGGHDIVMHERIGMIGRFIAQKGQHTLLAISHLQPWPVECWGASSTGMGATFSFKTANMMTKAGWTVVIEEPEGIGENTKRKRPMPWRATGKGDVRYMGGYADGVKVAKRLGVCVMLTGKNFSYGTECSMLEAMDAGCLVIAPKHLVLDDWKLLRLELFENSPSLKPGVSNENGEYTDSPDSDVYRPKLIGKEVLRELLDTVRMSEKLHGTKSHVDMAYHNRQLLEREHNPKKVAKKLLREAGF